MSLTRIIKSCNAVEILLYFYTFEKSMAKTTFWKKYGKNYFLEKSMAKTTFWKKYGKNYFLEKVWQKLLIIFCYTFPKSI